MSAAVLYPGEVMHRRLTPPRYRFRYRVFSLLLDIDRVAEAAATARLFSHNRFNLFSFHDADHGPRDGSPLRPWLERVLRGHGIDAAGGPVRLLSFPRVLGYGFNPLSLWYCHRRDGALVAVLCEVSNTFGERHGYLLHAGGDPLGSPVRQSRDKRFHVSPFMGMEGRYDFRIAVPDGRLAYAIREHTPEGPVLAAAQTGRATPFDDRHLLGAFAAVPFLGLKVIAAIHWQALKIWLRGGRFFRKPPPPGEEVTG